MEMLATAFLVCSVTKALQTGGIPEYVRGFLIGSSYFVVTASTFQFTRAGNNFAKMFAICVLTQNYLFILWFFLTTAFGFVLGFLLFYLLHSQQKRTSKLMVSDREVMDEDGNVLNKKDSEQEEVIRENKSQESV